MAPSLLLQSGSRRPRPSSGYAAEARASAATKLPPYEPPAQVLGEASRRELANVASNNDARKYQHHLVKSTDSLRDAVGAINEHLASQRAHLARLQERSKGGEKSQVQLHLEESIAELEATVPDLTSQIEEALREVIDFRAELEDEKKVFENVIELAGAQQPRVERRPKLPAQRRSRQQAAEGDELDDEDAAEEPEDEEMPDAQDEVPIQGLPALLEAQRDALANEYAALTVHQRYAENNDYRAFKKVWHSALHPDEDVPLADASTWFDAQGRPTWETAGQADEDDELVVERVVTDLKCPLSLTIMTEPYSNRKCKHTFQKSSILEFLQQNRGRAKCPVCTTDITTADLYLDDAFQRKVKRAMEAERQERAEVEDEDDDVGNSSVVAGPSRNIKMERGRSRRAEDVEESD
ncbi:zinc-finger of the MIZ type in Nse subunit-domain-containing protein [Cercophora newfieldiana]|uniref:Zinc-finger of the MIZ type in Nse subunit-domain-containing protein n=1 Tax=Cercophora newfieldiana TaxID=92897 RepID=A0AA39XXK1_9PEZI|nr:zinc-finger of the MIZ type in Nse subunit-domain-containing protein [Cercophora newfieldiana]